MPTRTTSLRLRTDEFPAPVPRPDPLRQKISLHVAMSAAYVGHIDAT